MWYLLNIRWVWESLAVEEKKKDEVARYLIITEPISDLCREPIDPRGGYEHNNPRETQPLLNEILLYKGEDEEWYQVEAVEQADFSTEALQPGDLIFVSNQDEFYKIRHVMIFLGGDDFIEASETGTVVKINSFRDKFGKTLVEIARQELVVDNKKIYCGKMPVSK
jgi:hypothetical protein